MNGLAVPALAAGHSQPTGSARREALGGADEGVAGRGQADGVGHRGIPEGRSFEIVLDHACQLVPGDVEPGEHPVRLQVLLVAGAVALYRLRRGLQRGRAELADAGVELLVAVTQRGDTMPGQ